MDVAKEDEAAIRQMSLREDLFEVLVTSDSIGSGQGLFDSKRLLQGPRGGRMNIIEVQDTFICLFIYR